MLCNVSVVLYLRYVRFMNNITLNNYNHVVLFLWQYVIVQCNNSLYLMLEYTVMLSLSKLTGDNFSSKSYTSTYACVYDS